MKYKDDYKPTFVDIAGVPPKQSIGRKSNFWKLRFDALPKGKAACLHFNNRQRTHQVANSLRNAAKYWKIKLGTRIIHGEPAIEGTDDWLLYFWRKQ